MTATPPPDNKTMTTKVIIIIRVIIITTITIPKTTTTMIVIIIDPGLHRSFYLRPSIIGCRKTIGLYGIFYGSVPPPGASVPGCLFFEIVIETPSPISHERIRLWCDIGPRAEIADVRIRRRRRRSIRKNKHLIKITKKISPN